MSDGFHLAALAVLALLCLAVRWAGFLAAAGRPLPPKLGRFIAAVPGPLLAALVASSAAASGLPAAVAVLAALLLMLILRNELLAALGGVALAFLFA